MTVKNYISSYNTDIQLKLNHIRNLFFTLYPQVEESIRYNMPCYKIGNEYLYFAAYKNHIGFYPIYNMVDFSSKIEPYKAKNAKDTLHFLYTKDLPIQLIKDIILYKIKKTSVQSQNSNFP